MIEMNTMLKNDLSDTEKEQIVVWIQDKIDWILFVTSDHQRPSHVDLQMFKALLPYLKKKWGING